MSFRVSSLARILDETFDNDLLKGVWAQGAVAGTGASPAAPGSGVLLARSWMLAAASPESGFRFVAGGQTRLRQVLLDQLRHYNNADVRFSTEASEIAAELILGGGLDRMTVGRAIAAVRPFGVDVSSGVESAKGIKDPAKIAAFMAEVRNADV